jgi:hypothetical protein
MLTLPESSLTFGRTRSICQGDREAPGPLRRRVRPTVVPQLDTAPSDETGSVSV